MRTRRGPAAAAVAFIAFLAACRQAPGQQRERAIDTDDFQLPDGYAIEAVVTGLSVPTSAVFEGEDLLVAESGHKKTALPRVLRIRPSGAVEVVAADGLKAPVTGLLTVDGALYVSHRETVSIVEGGRLRDVVTGLPSRGDHQNNQLVLGRDRRIYMGQGTVTNAGVVGVDNFVFGWLGEHPDVHEVPCRDVQLTGQNFESENPLTADGGDKAATGAYKPFGTPSSPGEVVPGSPRCGGSIVRFGLDGEGFELVASGLRNPFGLAQDASGRLWATSHGADVRGSRNVFNDPDYLVRVEEGAFYGWPDFFDGDPVTAARFHAPDKARPRMLWQHHPPLRRSFTTFASHSGACGLAFAPAGGFGYEGDAFVAAFGTFAPLTTGVNILPAGFRVLRVDIKSGEVHDFAKNDLPGPAFITRQDGFNRPVDVRFGPDDALYVVDWGATTVTREGLKLVPGTGVVWRIWAEGGAARRPQGPVHVAAAAFPEQQREPEVPNVGPAWRMVGGTLTLLAAGLVLLALLPILIWRRHRRRGRVS